MRQVEIKRKTNEVEIIGSLSLDGVGKTEITTGIEPLNHLLTLFAFHGLFDLKIKASGDLQHHLIEDIGIAVGKAFKEALAGKEGINRYGDFSLVMDKVLVEVSVDISGRPSLHGVFENNANLSITELTKGKRFDDTEFTFTHAEEFLESFLQHCGISMVYVIKSSQGDLHHILEALFKAMGKSLDQATLIDKRRQGVPSTKGIID
ncbi:MAG: imidazoleglycerol-phosphate dehydratase [Candidatus Omnitrophica bacterium]|nr:imidazoleglycerol-phosphate dehydratase [Candidatus Omnitrophota bacterium]